MKLGSIMGKVLFLIFNHEVPKMQQQYARTPIGIEHMVDLSVNGCSPI